LQPILIFQRNIFLEFGEADLEYSVRFKILTHFLNIFRANELYYNIQKV
jgi:hypothetical protein